MKMTLKEFANSRKQLPVIIHSIDMVGYQAAVIMDGDTYALVCESGKPLKHHSLLHMREALHHLPVASLTLQHQSAYDEMINQPTRQRNNTLSLPLALALYADAITS